MTRNHIARTAKYLDLVECKFYSSTKVSQRCHKKLIQSLKLAFCQALIERRSHSCDLGLCFCFLDVCIINVFRC